MNFEQILYPSGVVNAVADWILLGSLPAVILFAAFYSRSDWRSTRVGRALMYQALSMCLIVFIVCASLFLGTDYPGRSWVRLFGYSALTYALWRMFFVLRAYQREGEVAIIPLKKKTRSRRLKR